jgi:hypothetical protein
VGQHYGIHVYEGDRPVATFHNAEDARRAVEAMAAIARVEALCRAAAPQPLSTGLGTDGKEYSLFGDEARLSPRQIRDALAGEQS